MYLSGILQTSSLWEFLSPKSIHTDFSCNPHQYTAEIVSTEPLVIYINNFTSPTENIALVEAGYHPISLHHLKTNVHPQRTPSHNIRSLPGRHQTSLHRTYLPIRPPPLLPPSRPMRANARALIPRHAPPSQRRLRHAPDSALHARAEIRRPS